MSNNPSLIARLAPLPIIPAQAGTQFFDLLFREGWPLGVTWFGVGGVGWRRWGRFPTGSPPARGWW